MNKLSAQIFKKYMDINDEYEGVDSQTVCQVIKSKGPLIYRLCDIFEIGRAHV